VCLRVSRSPLAVRRHAEPSQVSPMRDGRLVVAGATGATRLGSWVAIARPICLTCVAGAKRSGQRSLAAPLHEKRFRGSVAIGRAAPIRQSS
jgi:hypothetical protein